MATTIILNENNPLGVSAIDTMDLNYAGQGNFWRYYLESGLATPIKVKYIYDYMVREGYRTPVINFDQTFIDNVIAENPTYVEEYNSCWYPLAGGITGGILCAVSGTDSVNFRFLTSTDASISWFYPASTKYTLGTQTLDQILYLVSSVYTNGSLVGNNAGLVEAPCNISYLGGLGQDFIPCPAENMADVLQFTGDNPFNIDPISLTPISFKAPNYYGEPSVLPQRKAFFDWISTSDLVPDKDPYDDAGYTIPDGGDGEVRQSVTIEQPELPPEALMDSGIVQMYAPTKQELNDFMAYIYSQPDAFFNNVKKLWANPMESIISCSIVPFDVSAEKTTAEVIKFCGISTNVSMTKVKQYKRFEMGTLPIPKESNSALDYNNFTKVKAFLPFIGIVDLNTDDCMGADLNLIYNVDMLSGDCIASIQCIRNDVTYKNNYKAPLYQFKGNVILQAPITGNNYAGLYGGVANMVQATAIPSAGAIMGASASNLLGQKVTVQRSGTLSGNTGTLGDYTPYVIIESPIQSTTKEMFKRQGYPSNIMCSVQSLNDSKNNVWGGFTVFQKDSVFVEGINATDEEKAMIKQILETGIIFNEVD